jgi:hypothetical protein
MTKIRNRSAFSGFRKVTEWDGVRIALVALLALCTAKCSRDKARAASEDTATIPNVAVTKVARSNLSQGLRVAAEFRPFQEIDVHAKVAGFVKRI